jgi:hypothetical protein
LERLNSRKERELNNQIEEYSSALKIERDVHKRITEYIEKRRTEVTAQANLREAKKDTKSE